MSDTESLREPSKSCDRRPDVSPCAASVAAQHRHVCARPAPDDVQRCWRSSSTSSSPETSSAYLDLVAGNANRTRATEFGRSEFQPGATRAVVKERERVPFGSSHEPTGYRVVARRLHRVRRRADACATWQLDLQRRDDEPGRSSTEQRLTSVERLFRLSLDADNAIRRARTSRFTPRISTLTLDSGSVFVSSVEGGVTGPRASRARRHALPPEARHRTHAGPHLLRQRDARGAVHGGLRPRRSRPISTRFIDVGQLTAVPVDARELKRATDVFKQDFTKSYHLDLGDLSSDPWSLLPGRATSSPKCTRAASAS